MKTSNRGISRIKRFERFMPKAYICPGGVLSIGYGHTKNVNPGMVISKEKADKLLKEDIEEFEEVINSSINKNIKLNQNQFDALVSLAYNIGGSAFKGSTILRKINQGKRKEASIHFLDWIKVDGATSLGLTRRRIEEQKLFLS